MLINTQATLTAVGAVLLIRLKQADSATLPSRGLVMADGMLNGFTFTLPLEPDGEGGHWLQVPEWLREQAEVNPGDTAALTLTPTDAWPEPDLPGDLMNAVSLHGLLPQWESLTVKARWSWLRWIRATLNPATRNKRILVAVGKLSRGDRRPCCFNAASCTVPEVSKGGVLRA